MNKRLLTSLLSASLMLSSAYADTYVKREVRGAWMATVSNIDWPSVTGTTLGIRRQQQNEMIKYLDIMQEAGINAIYFQTRPMADALYNSSYEPWSGYLTGTRGTTRLGWDPLTFMVDECHKRGMECHAWVNPYRWKRSSDPDWNTSKDKDLKNKGMLISYNDNVIFNPALDATRQRIVDVCQEMIENYDIDGIIFDDYFYPSGMPTTSAADDYNDWRNSGTGKSFGDWRRENVNRMVADVYNMIQKVDPTVKFGISPAGAACSDANVAASHGVEPIPKGSDWQYNGIFSDPVAWLKAGTIDYISPQLYWKTDHTTNPFGPMTQWWSKVAKQFGRHHYASHSLTFLQSSNTEADWKEVGKQVQYSRSYNGNGAPGAIFYSACDIDGKKVQGLGEWLKANKFQHPALPPAIKWKEHEELGTVTGLRLEDNVLSWDDMGRVRYSIYAIPKDLEKKAVEKSTAGGILSQYLLGAYYTNTFEIPAEYQEGYDFAVCIMDRYSNEYAAFYTRDINDDVIDIAEAQIKIELEDWQLRFNINVDDVQVVSTTGILMSHEQNCASLPLTGFPTGFYIVKALTGKQSTIKKIYIR